MEVKTLVIDLGKIVFLYTTSRVQANRDASPAFTAAPAS